MGFNPVNFFVRGTRSDVENPAFAGLQCRNARSNLNLTLTLSL